MRREDHAPLLATRVAPTRPLPSTSPPPSRVLGHGDRSFLGKPARPRGPRACTARHLVGGRPTPLPRVSGPDCVFMQWCRKDTAHRCIPTVHTATPMQALLDLGIERSHRIVRTVRVRGTGRGAHVSVLWIGRHTVITSWRVLRGIASRAVECDAASANNSAGSSSAQCRAQRGRSDGAPSSVAGEGSRLVQGPDCSATAIAASKISSRP
jgi:hypothetical protein